MNDNISSPGMAFDCLNSTKYLALKDARDTMESATPEVRQAFIDMAGDHLKMAEEWFHLIESKGWYFIPESSTNLSSELANHILNLAQREGQYNALNHWD